MASFTPGMPTGSQSLGQTQQPVQDNFTVINTTIAQDHVQIGFLKQGRHNWVRLQNNPPMLPATDATEVLLYNDAIEQLTLRLFGGTNDVNMAPGNDVTLTIPFLGASPSGWSFLPGGSSTGLFIQYGSVNTPGTSGTVSFPVQFKNPGVFSITLTPYNPTTTNSNYWVAGTPPSTTQFTYQGNVSASKLFWMAIGRR